MGVNTLAPTLPGCQPMPCLQSLVSPLVTGPHHELGRAVQRSRPRARVAALEKVSHRPRITRGFKIYINLDRDCATHSIFRPLPPPFPVRRHRSVLAFMRNRYVGSTGPVPFVGLAAEKLVQMPVFRHVMVLWTGNIESASKNHMVTLHTRNHVSWSVAVAVMTPYWSGTPTTTTPST